MSCKIIEEEQRNRLENIGWKSPGFQCIRINAKGHKCTGLNNGQGIVETLISHLAVWHASYFGKVNKQKV